MTLAFALPFVVAWYEAMSAPSHCWWMKEAKLRGG